MVNRIEMLEQVNEVDQVDQLAISRLLCRLFLQIGQEQLAPFPPLHQSLYEVRVISIFKTI